MINNHYRPMVISDYPESYALWASASGIGMSEADNRENIARYLERNPEQSFVCLVNGQIAGTILCGNDGRRAYIHHTAVATEHRRRGIAAELVRLALDKQKEYGITKCHLFIYNENQLGKEFWGRMKFSERQEIGIMSRNL